MTAPTQRSETHTTANSTDTGFSTTAQAIGAGDLFTVAIDLAAGTTTVPGFIITNAAGSLTTEDETIGVADGVIVYKDAVTTNSTGSITNGSATIASLSPVVANLIGCRVTGTGIPSATYVTAATE